MTNTVRASLVLMLVHMEVKCARFWFPNLLPVQANLSLELNLAVVLQGLLMFLNGQFCVISITYITVTPNLGA